MPRHPAPPALLQRVDHLVIGAGAAGLAAAKLFAASKADVTLLEAHAEPGGSAGFFARGNPRRQFDAGATQLIGCEPGGLQSRLLALGSAAAARESQADKLAFERIETLTHHFPHARLTLLAQGGLRYEGSADGGFEGTSDSGSATIAFSVDTRGALEPTFVPFVVSARLVEDLRALVRVIETCAREAEWMWKVFNALPRFPLETSGDVVRALSLAKVTPPSRIAAFPLLLASSFETACRAMGLRGEHAHARAVLEGLLLDTTQNTLAGSPYLAGLMGVTILRQGIHRARGGMRPVFRALLSDVRAEGARVVLGDALVALEPTPEGWLARTHSGASYLATRGVVCNLTLWDLVSLLAPYSAVTLTSTFACWREAIASAAGESDTWGAFAVYATFADETRMPSGPWFHQVFPRGDSENGLAAKANYVSTSGRDDPCAPRGARVLTTTLHVPPRPLSPADREALTRALIHRTEAALGVTLENIETATPSTYGRYVGRSGGRVGGFAVTRERFLLNAPPSFLRVPGNPAPLAVAGDTVFPGQGIIACLASGIAAWERITGSSFAELERALCATPAYNPNNVPPA